MFIYPDKKNKRRRSQKKKITNDWIIIKIFIINKRIYIKKN